MLKFKVVPVKPLDNGLVCQNLKRIRQHLELSQLDMCKYAGVSEGAQHQYEQGRSKNIFLDTVYKSLWLFNQLVREGCEITIEDLCGEINVNKIRKRSV